MKTLITTILIAGLLLAVWLLSDQPPRTPASVISTAPATPERSATQAPLVTPPAAYLPPAEPESGKLEHATSIPPPKLPEPMRSQSLFKVAEGIRQRIQTWTFDDYQLLVERDEPLDGEAAYTAYQFARGCADGITTERELLLRRAQFSNYFDQNRERLSENRLNRALDKLESSLAHCQGMGEDVLDVAMDWLQLAAELDYLPALIKFPEDVPQLLNEDSWTVFRRPDLLEIYRLRAPEFLGRALVSGHPDAFRAYAKALRDGLALDPDPVLAQAMELTATLAEGNVLPIGTSNPALTAEENADALDRSNWLCQRYCR